jgi:hypothetical protein
VGSTLAHIPVGSSSAMTLFQPYDLVAASHCSVGLAASMEKKEKKKI